MSYYNDPFGRYSRAQQPPARRSSGAYQQAQASQPPTLDDYKQIVVAYQELQKERTALAKQVETGQEALRQQTRKAIELKDELDQARAEAKELASELQTLADARQAEQENEWQERYLRLQAEMENYRRRLEQRSVADVERQRMQVLEDMLPLADHLEMALQHVAAAPGEEVPDAGRGPDAMLSFRQNLDATLQAFLETLRKYGVQRLDPQGQPFDPTVHEAVGQIPNADVPEDHVAAVVRTGYLAGDKLLRPARVLVSGGAA